MDLLKQTMEICQQNGIKPARSKGQNFLIREDVYDKIVEAADIGENDYIMEVGPGLGFLTAKIVARAKKLVTVELDDKLADLLKTNTMLKGDKIEIINQNVLDFYEHDIFSHPYKIVANLPYNITSVFLRKFLTTMPSPERFVLMLQKEVAERITAKPGDMSLLALSVQFYAEAEIVLEVPAEDFWPKPEVDSAVIRIKTREHADVKEKDFFRLVKFGFTAKRKMLKNNLSAGLHITTKEAEEKLVSVGLNPKIRAEELSIENWVKLLKVI